MRTNPAVVGLDIGSNSIRLVCLTGFGTPKVFAFSEVEAPKNVFTPHSMREKDKLAISLKTALANTKPHSVKARYVCASLPESVVFTKVITLPRLHKKEFNLAVNEEVSQILPRPIEEMEVDHQILGFLDQEIDVLVIAAEKTLVLDIIELTNGAGLELIRLDTKPISLGRLILGNNKSTAILVDIGSEVSSISIYDYGMIRVTATVPVGGESWQEEITKKENREGRKKVLATDYVATLNVLIEEIKKAISYHQSRSLAPRPIERVILAGGGSQLVGLGDLFQEKLALPAGLAEPVIKLPSGMDNRYFVACGASLEPPI